MMQLMIKIVTLNNVLYLENVVIGVFLLRHLIYMWCNFIIYNYLNKIENDPNNFKI